LGGTHPATVVEVNSIVDGTNVGVYTADGYQALETVSLAGSNFKIGGFGASVPSTAPVDLSVPLTITDGDGDLASGSISASLLPSTQTQDDSAMTSGVALSSTTTQPNLIGGSGNDTLTGLNGTNDILYGGAGNDTLNAGTTGVDILIGGPGNNTLNGTATPSTSAHDEFVLQVSTGEHDIINNFNATFDGILVDVGAGGTIASAMASSGIASTELVSGQGTGSGNADPSNLFNGVNHFAFNTTTHELYYSPDTTAAHAIDLAHISTGVPTAASIHTL
jgi:Ca2+-binding RTX toxin-like protein